MPRQPPCPAQGLVWRPLVQPPNPAFSRSGTPAPTLGTSPQLLVVRPLGVLPSGLAALPRVLGRKSTPQTGVTWPPPASWSSALPYTPPHLCTHTHAHLLTLTPTRSHSHPPHIHPYPHTCSHIHAYLLTLTPAHSHTHLLTHTCSHIHTYSHNQPAHTHPHTHTCAHAAAHPHTQLTVLCSHSFTHLLICSHSPVHTHSHTHCHTNTSSPPMHFWAVLNNSRSNTPRLGPPHVPRPCCRNILGTAPSHERPICLPPPPTAPAPPRPTPLDSFRLPGHPPSLFCPYPHTVPQSA